jgi:sodium-dependent dicarboxylate transporter 2/3/5
MRSIRPNAMSARSGPAINGPSNPPGRIRVRNTIQWCGLLLGPLLALACYQMLPLEYRDAHQQLVQFSGGGRWTLAMMVWMGVWWLTETVDMAVTALLPLALFPLLGIATIEKAASPYANPLVFLFMGGFLLALSMQRWQLDRRIAISALRQVGTRPPQIVAGFMAITGLISAFVSNTATTAMMLPIALSVLRLTEARSGGKEESRDPRAGTPDANGLGPCLMLAIAYSASIGGMATIVGTPTNLFLVSYLRDSAPEAFRSDVGFARWLCVGLPLTIIYLPITWWLLAKVLFRLPGEPIAGGRELLDDELQKLGPVRRGEWITLLAFLATAVLWVVRPWLQGLEWSTASGTLRPFAGLSDTSIVMCSAIALFLIPVDVGRREFVLDWGTAEKLPLGLLLLFGGGLSLADAVSTNQVAEYLGSHASHLAGLPDLALVLIVTTFVIFFTEMTSNAATVATLVPLLVVLAPSLEVHPYLLAYPATLAASCAFMLPVATPPNALVFSGGYVRIGQMIRAGWWLNLVGIVLITLLTQWVVKPLLVP